MVNSTLGIFVFLVILVPFSIAQSNGIVDKEVNIQACVTRFFIPEQSAQLSEVTGEVELVRCTKPSERVCDISGGILQKNFDGVSCLIAAGFNFAPNSGDFLYGAATTDFTLFRLIFESISPSSGARQEAGERLLVRLSNQLPSGLIKRRFSFSWDAVESSTEFLLESGINPNSRSADGMTPLMYLVRTGSDKSIELLLKHGADPNLQTPEGKTALMLASDETTKVKLLLDANADIYLRDDVGRTAIQYAVAQCQLNKLRLIIDRDPASIFQVAADDVSKLDREQRACREVRKLIRNAHRRARLN